MNAIVDALTGNVVLVGLLVGVITPPITAVIQRPTWSKNTRIVVAGAASVVLGFITAATTGALTDPGNLFAVIAAVAVAAEATYEKLWQPSGAAGAIEKATSPKTTDS